MDAATLARLKDLTRELAELLYEETPPEDLDTLKGIEQSVRGHLLDHVGPEIANFLSKRAATRLEDESALSPASLDNSPSLINKGND